MIENTKPGFPGFGLKDKHLGEGGTQMFARVNIS